MTAHFSHNPSTHSEKIKVVVKPPLVQADPAMSFFMQGVLSFLLQASHVWPLVDRGHTHTDGSVEVAFFLKHVAKRKWGEPAGIDPPAGGSIVRSAERSQLESQDANATFEQQIIEPFDAVRLVGEWQQMPQHGWSGVYNNFEAYRTREQCAVPEATPVPALDQPPGIPPPAPLQRGAADDDSSFSSSSSSSSSSDDDVDDTTRRRAAAAAAAAPAAVPAGGAETPQENLDGPLCQRTHDMAVGFKHDLAVARSCDVCGLECAPDIMFCRACGYTRCTTCMHQEFREDVESLVQRGGSYAEFAQHAMKVWSCVFESIPIWRPTVTWDEYNQQYRRVHGSTFWNALCERFRGGTRDPLSCSHDFLQLVQKIQSSWTEAYIKVRSTS
jgi:hypothetical protein